MYNLYPIFRIVDIIVRRSEYRYILLTRRRDQYQYFSLKKADYWHKVLNIQ
jgi:hypothetical protein